MGSFTLLVVAVRVGGLTRSSVTVGVGERYLCLQFQVDRGQVDVPRLLGGVLQLSQMPVDAPQAVSQM